MSKSMTSILRKFFTREVIKGFTAKKKIEDKTLLKTTNFGMSMIGNETFNWYTLFRIYDQGYIDIIIVSHLFFSSCS